MSITDFEAARKWSTIPKSRQQLLVSNVFCSACGVTTIVKYTLHNDKYGILLKGQCKQCGTDVARLVENE